jgi:hypothetical protein
MLPVTLKVKPLSPQSLILRKRLCQLLNLGCRLFEGSTPDMDIVARQYQVCWWKTPQKILIKHNLSTAKNY